MKRAIFILLLLPLFATARVKEFAVSDYQTLINYYVKQKNPKQTLFVFDIDDTLLTPKGDLGSSAFWDWQVSLLKENSHDKLLFANNIEELSDIEGFLLSRAQMLETDNHLATLLKLISKRKSAVVSLTARVPEFSETTLRQLSKKSFKTKSGQLVFEKNGVTINHRASILKPFRCHDFKRVVIYRHGVMFVSGQDKGLALKCLLKHAHKHYSSIIFVDDSRKNVSNVERVFESEINTSLIAILYTREREKSLHFLHSAHLKTLAYQKWQKMKQAYKRYRLSHHSND